MNFDQTILNSVKRIVKNRGQAKAVEEFQSCMNKDGWPIAYAKSTACEAIRALIREELPDDPVQMFTSMMMGSVVKPIKLTKSQKNSLTEVIKIIGKAKRQYKCEHNLGIAPFIHGGGFTPTHNIPELICLKCGLNVTLPERIEVGTYRKDFGIVITKKALNEINNWANNLDIRRNRVYSSSDITKDPIGMYNKSAKWTGQIPIKISNRRKLESKSGI